MVRTGYAVAVALTCAAALAAAGSAPAPAGTAPLTITGTGFAVAPVSLNGAEPVPLVVDTAASSSALFPRLVERLGLKKEDAQGVAVQGASGLQRVDLHRVGPVSVGGRSVEGLAAVVLNAPHLSEVDGGVLHGILGADFLSSFDVEMDFAAGALRLEPPARNAPADGADYEALFGRFVVVEAKVNGTPVTAVVDTGARRTLLNWPAARALGLTEQSPELKADEPVRGATTHATPAWSWTAGRLEGAGASWSEPPLGVSDLPVFRALGLHEKPAMILGANLLRDRLLRIDYDERRVLIGPASGE